ncbi:hypothetical protein SELMODRAFT_425092 [Selaginella moellendorffii]|uniref:Uncharacterized protein n=1 Tax=Selaginella moellendorffii TaxID=88036 RepID=D8SS02_SELML|nr:hypothetical protein SELMODRAFT_425092 [Selaginella moellendorffii]
MEDTRQNKRGGTGRGRNPETTARQRINVGAGNPRKELMEGNGGITVKIVANREKNEARMDVINTQRAGVKGTRQVTVGGEGKKDKATHGDAWGENLSMKSKEGTCGGVMSEEKPKNPRKQSCALSTWTGKGEEKRGGVGSKWRNDKWQPGSAPFKGDMSIRRALFSVKDEGQLEDKGKAVSERRGKDKGEKSPKGKRVVDEVEGMEGKEKGEKEGERRRGSQESEGEKQKKEEDTGGSMPRARTMARMSTAGERARGVQLPEVLDPEEALTGEVPVVNVENKGKEDSSEEEGAPLTRAPRRNTTSESLGTGEENAPGRMEKEASGKEAGVGSPSGIKRRVKTCCLLDKGPPCFKAIREANAHKEQEARRLAEEEAKRILEDEAEREKATKEKQEQEARQERPIEMEQTVRTYEAPVGQEFHGRMRDDKGKGKWEEARQWEALSSRGTGRARARSGDIPGWEARAGNRVPEVPFGPPPVKIEEIMPPRKPTRMPHGPASDVLEVDPKEFMEELNKLQARRAEETLHVIVEGAVPAGFVVLDWVCAALAYHDMLVTVLAEDVKDLGEKCYNVVIKDERARHKLLRVDAYAQLDFQLFFRAYHNNFMPQKKRMLLPPSVIVNFELQGMDVALAEDKILAAILRQFATFIRMEGTPVGDRVTVKVRIPKEVHIPFEIELKPGKGEVPRRIRVMLLPNPSVCIICRRTGHIGKHCLARGASMGGMPETGEDRQKANSGSEGKKRGARGEREIIEKAASSGESKKPRTKGQKEEGQGEQSTAAKQEKGQSRTARGKEWRPTGRLFEGQAVGEAKGPDTEVETVQDKGELPPQQATHRAPGPVEQEQQQSRSRSGRTEDFARGNCPLGFTPPRRAVCEIELYVSGTNPPKFLGEWIDNRVGYAPSAILISPGQDIGWTLEDILAYNFNWNPQRFSIREDNFVEQAPNLFKFRGTVRIPFAWPLRPMGPYHWVERQRLGSARGFRNEHRLSSMDLVYKFTKGKYFWNPAVSCSGGTLIVVKGQWESLVEEHAILIGDMLVGLLNVYAPAGSSSERADFWNELVHRIPAQPSTWMVTGDFNFVEEVLDKDGGEMRDKRTSRERAMWAQLVLALGLEDTYNIPGFVQHQPSGKLDIATGYRDFSDHNSVSLTLPILKRWGTKRPAPVSRKNFEDGKLNDYIKEKWNQQEGGDLHKFTIKIANEIRKKTQNKRRKVFKKVQAIRRNIEAIKRLIRLDPLDTSLRTQLARTKAQLFTLEAEKMEAFIRSGHLK